MTTALARPLRRTAALLALAALAFAIGAGAAADAAPPAQRRYPPEIRRAFIRSCTNAAKTAAGDKLARAQAGAYCRSALACIERHLTPRQFAQTVRNMQAGRRNPNARVFTSCERAAAKRVRG
jgi:hypothetical protein